MIGYTMLGIVLYDQITWSLDTCIFCFILCILY
jgi:hypothetical protein